MLTDWKNCENVNVTHGNLHIQCNPFQNTMDFLQRVGKNHFKICVESEKTSNSQRNIEKENQSLGHHNARFQVVLQSCDHQESMALAQKQRIHKWALNSMVNSSLTKQGRLSTGKRRVSSINHLVC